MKFDLECLNTHGHFHVCVVDGVFEVGAQPHSDADDPNNSSDSSEAEHLRFHANKGLATNTINTVQQGIQQTARQRILSAFVVRACSNKLEPRFSIRRVFDAI